MAKEDESGAAQPAPPHATAKNGGETLEGLLDGAAGAARDRGREELAKAIERVRKPEQG